MNFYKLTFKYNEIPHPCLLINLLDLLLNLLYNFICIKHYLFITFPTHDCITKFFIQTQR